MIWRDGVVPDGAQEFSSSLTSDLLDLGYGILALALELRDANRARNPNARSTQMSHSEWRRRRLSRRSAEEIQRMAIRGGNLVVKAQRLFTSPDMRPDPIHCCRCRRLRRTCPRQSALLDFY